MTLHSVRQRLGSVMMLRDRGELRTDFGPLWLTDEDAFRALWGRGVGIFVGRADDPEVGGRGTSAAFVLDSIEEVERFLDRLAR